MALSHVATVIIIIATLAALAWGVARARSPRTDTATLAGIAGPVLRELQQATGLESTFVTRIDWARASQEIVWARNGRRLQLPEGLVVDWPDNLSAKVSDGSGPDEATSFRTLGVGTSLRVPILTAEGRLYGTLGGASAAAHPVPEGALVAARRCARALARSVAA